MLFMKIILFTTVISFWVLYSDAQTERDIQRSLQILNEENIESRLWQLKNTPYVFEGKVIQSQCYESLDRGCVFLKINYF